MKILCITHADFETPGIIQDWAESKKFDFTICRPYKGNACLKNDNFDFLIVMGGPQSACKLDEYEYLFDEIQLIQKAIALNKTVIGFCLGAQLIGAALNAPASKSPEKEVGVFPVMLTEAARSNPIFKNFTNEFPAIHWHNDMPGLTSDAEILAYSKGCPRQIIKYGERVYGFQCHLEITREGIETMIKSCSEDLIPSTYTQTSKELLAQDYKTINNSMIKILNALSNLK